jgi:hypothetical protein
LSRWEGYKAMPKKKQGEEKEHDREAFVAELPSFDRFEALTERLLKVPKEELDEKRAEREKKQSE